MKASASNRKEVVKVLLQDERVDATLQDKVRKQEQNKNATIYFFISYCVIYATEWENSSRAGGDCRGAETGVTER